MRRNTIVTLVMLGTLVYIIYLIPQLSKEQSRIKKYDYVSEFMDDFVAGHIAQVKVTANYEAQGKFKSSAVEGYTDFVVEVPADPEFVDKLMALNDSKGLGVQIGAPRMSMWDKVMAVGGPFLLPLLLLGVFWVFMMRQMNNSRGQAMSFGRSGARMLNDNLERVTFDDVAGMLEVKEELQEVVEFLKSPEQFRALGAKIPRGVLLVGPPGCGKTLLARAVAGEAEVSFFYLSGSDFVEMFVGVGASRVRDLFQQAKAQKPSMIFIDEMDAVGRLRGAGIGGGHDEREQTLNALLVEMDGFEAKDDVILLAATNRPDILDPALLRPGRFDRQIVVPMPNVAERREIFDIYVKDKPVDEVVDLDMMARRSVGFSGADIENIVNEAALLAARNKKAHVEPEDFDEALERVIAGPERKSRVISEDDRRVLAYHEAGHALVGYLIPGFDEVYKVTILPRGQSLGYTISLPEAARYIMGKQEMLDRMAQALGGRAAEELVLNNFHTGAAQDIEMVSQMARAMVTEYGMTDELGPITYGRKTGPIFLGRDFAEERNYSEDIAGRIDETIRKIVDECYDHALTLLRESRDKLDLLVDNLLEYETLDQEQVTALMETGALPVETASAPATDDGDEATVEAPADEPETERVPAPRLLDPDPQTP